MGEMARDSAKDRIVEVPRLVEVGNIVSITIRVAPLPGFVKISSERLIERYLSKSLRTLEKLAFNPRAKYQGEFTLSIRSCKGAKVANMPSMSWSPKYLFDISLTFTHALKGEIRRLIQS